MRLNQLREQRWLRASKYGGWDMLRKAMIALFAVASIAVLVPGMASARGFGGGGWHGGGWHGGYGRGFPFVGAAIGLGVGYGLYGYNNYGYYGGYPAAYGDPYYYGGDDGECYVVRRRVMTRHGWRLRPMQVC
jgi:hypothetical protein